MRFFILVAASIAALVLPAYGGTVTYNFDDGTLDGLTPFVTSGYAYNVSGGVLNVSNTSSGPGGGITIETPFNVSGDFTATADVSRTLLGTDGVMELSNVFSGGFGSAYLYDNHIESVIQPNDVFGSAGVPNTTVRLQVARLGNTITTSYSVDGGANYSPLNSASNPAYGGTTYFELVLEQASPGENGYFDNLTITSDSISAVPLPSAASAGLSLLAVMLGWKFVSRRLSQVA